MADTPEPEPKKRYPQPTGEEDEPVLNGSCKTGRGPPPQRREVSVTEAQVFELYCKIPKNKPSATDVVNVVKEKLHETLSRTWVHNRMKRSGWREKRDMIRKGKIDYAGNVYSGVIKALIEESKEMEGVKGAQLLRGIQSRIIGKLAVHVMDGTEPTWLKGMIEALELLERLAVERLQTNFAGFTPPQPEPDKPDDDEKKATEPTLLFARFKERAEAKSK